MAPCRYMSTYCTYMVHTYILYHIHTYYISRKTCILKQWMRANQKGGIHKLCWPNFENDWLPTYPCLHLWRNSLTVLGWKSAYRPLTFRVPTTQWIFLLYRRLQKIEQVKPDHCDRYQNNRNKNCNWMALVSYIGNCGNISQISLKCRKSLNLVKLLKSWQFIISLKTFGGLINYFK